MMNIIFLGPPGSGKGTQAKLVVKKFNYQYFESGNLLREKAKEESDIGRKIKEILEEGGLISDEDMVKIVNDWLDKTEIKQGIVFDGYPRTLNQFKDLLLMLSRKRLKVDKVIYVKLSAEETIRRLTARRICPQCDAEFNLITKSPKQDEICDQCQTKLIQREDDTVTTVNKRLSFQWPQTQTLIDFIRQQGILEEVDGERPIEVIHQDILARLEK